MIQNIDTISLKLVEQLKDFTKIVWNADIILSEIFKYSKVNLVRFNDLQESLEQMQLSLPLIRMNAQSLREAYVSQYAGIHGVREGLIEKIKNNRSKGNQINLLPSQYDENNLINEVIPASRDEHTTRFKITDARIDPIIDPSSYSNSAIVKRFEMEDLVIMEINDDTQDLFKILEENANASLRDIINAIQYCISPEISNLIDSDAFRDSFEYDSAVRHAIPIRRIANRFSGSAEAVLKAFNVLQEMIHNYMIYEIAVKSYTATALESVLGPNFDYKLN